MEKMKDFFKKIWDWMKGAGRKIVAVAASILSVLFIGKILSKKKAEREILKKEIKDLKKEIKNETKEVENKTKKVEESESLVEEALKNGEYTFKQDYYLDSRKEEQLSKKVDLKDILPDL